MQRTPMLSRTLAATMLFAALPMLGSAQAKIEPPSAQASNSSNSETEYERQRRFRDTGVDRTYKLRFAPTAADQNELLTAIRNVVEPATKIFLIPSISGLVVHAPLETQAQVAALLNSLDQPRPRYRIIYTISEFDGTRKIGMQHFSTVLASAQHGQLKQGSRIPVITGSPTGGVSTQFQYVDVGMNFDATITEIQGGAVLKSKVEQTSIAPDTPSPSLPNPVIRQTFLEGTTQLILNKQLLLGSLDVPSSTHRFDVEVEIEIAN